ncbi:TFIID subunit, WD40-associated region [Kalmanozyma brasiliensis GHG001]|uniref:TFIID subunit TAF5 NTD2 domain-containing protein n=1 Tax=Kalmanozyma brasiliensis (strain GHG001) TaxID=1365824 RepID=V5EKE0_KALBG|nr:TFIID subunit, WD40-associated region [Kalmanozyma brasiliensis GHG001]EST05355.1 TFIID subunit, WD40-associated region [Kalmanozyma brasiliensis GHG001]
MPAPTAAAASAADDKAAINDKAALGKTTDSTGQTPKDGTIPLPSTSAASGSAAPANEASAGSVFSSPDMTAAVLTYLQKRGFDRVEAAFKAELDALASGASAEQAAAAADKLGRPPTVSLEDLAARNAPRTTADKDGDKDKDAVEPTTKDQNAVADGDLTFAEDGDVSAAATQALLLDPTDRARGFAMLKSWCHGSLDIYQPELLPILLPLFVHSFLDLVLMGHGPAASALYTAHAASFLPTHTALLSQIRSLALPSHIQSDSLAQRFRSERYIVKMSNTVFSLLLGWLTDGGGPVSGSTSSLEEAEAPARRGREAMLKIINERCRIQVLAAQPYQIDAAVLEEGTGLTGAGPTYSSVTTGAAGRSRMHASISKNAVTRGDALAEFNARAAGPQLKLHPTVPLTERLETEVQKELQEVERREKETTAAVTAEQNKEAEASGSTAAAAQEGADGSNANQQQDGDATMQDATAGEDAQDGDAASRARTASVRPSEPPTSAPGTAPPTTAAEAKSNEPDFSGGLLAASITDLPPQAPTFRTVDVKREVQRVRDARKRIRLDPSLLSASTSTGFTSGVRDPALNGLGEQGAHAARVAALPSVCAYTFHDADDGITCSTFSDDITLMAAGFEESFVQLWSLKGEKLRGVRGNPHLSSIRDSRTLARQREAESYSTRRLIGHSGPVYAVDFDPVGGSASPPRHLLSCSADATARLWSLDTYSALVAYRGHQHPVWDVKWSPIGTYFATASADKTARLWSTERVNPLRMYAGHLSDVDCLTFHPNSLYLATGSSDRSCRLWDVQRGACVRLFVGHQSAISCVKISPDGRYLASAAAGNGTASQFTGVDGVDPTSRGAHQNDVAISLWDLASGRRIKKMWGHEERVYSMDFSADGSLLVTGSEDCSVRCWDVRAVGGARKVPAKGSLEAQQAVGGAGMGAPTPAQLASGGLASAAAASQTSGADLANTSADCVATFHTKRTPVLDVHFTPRNLCLVAGVYED